MRLKFRYQKGLTKHLKIYGLTNPSLIRKCSAFQLLNFLTMTLLVPDHENALLLISSRLVFLNGRLATNKTLIIVEHDFIQLLVSFQYYILYK